MWEVLNYRPHCTVGSVIHGPPHLQIHGAPHLQSEEITFERALIEAMLRASCRHARPKIPTRLGVCGFDASRA